ncbi:MAG: glutamine amidotransferase [Armatimonadota bacterium]
MTIRRAMLLMTALVALLVPHFPVIAGPDDDAAAKQGLKPPVEWLFPPHQPLRVLAVRGLWYQMYGVERALARTGGAYLTDSWHSTEALRYFPNSYEGLMGHHLVIICNVNGNAIKPATRKMLKDYVENGGSLLLLGGYFGLGKQYHDTAVEEIAPVTFPTDKNLSNAPDGLPLAPGKDAGNNLTTLSWAAAPRVFWYHEITPKPEAKILLTAGGKPMLVTGTFGKGRVAVFAGSVMGVPKAGQLPCWEWNDWPAVLAETINWLTEQSGKSGAVPSSGTLDQLRKKLLGPGQKKLADVGPLLTQTARICSDKETAKLLLNGIYAIDGDAPLEMIEQIDDAVRPFVDVEMKETIIQLIESDLTHKISFGLRLLGQIKAPDAKGQLESALKTGDVERADAIPDELLLNPKVPEDPKYRNYAIRLGALEGLGNLGNAVELPLLKIHLKQYGKLRTDPTTQPEELTQEDELYQEAVLAALRCGNSEAAAPTIDLLLENRYLVIRMINVLDAPYYMLTDEELVRKQRRLSRSFSRMRARDMQLYRRLTTVPATVLPALAQRMAAEEDPRVIPIAFAVFGADFHPPGFTIPKEAADALRGAKLPAVAELAGRAQ